MDPLVSPSKAAQAARQAKDWAYVQSWLVKQYAPNKVPVIERTDEVLQALLDLAAASEAANEQAELLHRARQEELQVRERGSQDPTTKVLDEVETGLDERGWQVLRELAETAALLGVPDGNATMMGQRIVDLTKEAFEAAGQSRAVESIRAYLEKEIGGVKDALEVMQVQEEEGDSGVRAMEVQRQIMQWKGENKQLEVKLKEYEERIKDLEVAKKGAPTMESITQEEIRVGELQEQAGKLADKLRVYAGLPPDLEAAKGELRRSQEELQELKRRRERLFEAMVGT